VLQSQSGRGVAKGDVTLTQRVRVGEKTYRWFDVGTIQADDNGHYGFCNVPEGTYFVNSQGTMRTSAKRQVPNPCPRITSRLFIRMFWRRRHLSRYTSAPVL
jgi:hypothetical protein